MTKTKTKKQLIKDILFNISFSRRMAQKERDDAIKNKEWSKVSGYDGIDIGLLKAEKIIMEEIKER